MKIVQRRKVLWSTLFLAGFLLGGIIYLQRIPLSVFVWEHFHAARTAALLNSDPLFLVEIGNYYFNDEKTGVYDLKKAKHYFEKAIEKDELVPDAWHQLARIAFLEGKYSEALYDINTQIYLHGRNLMSAYYMRGLIYGYSRRYPEAQENFKVYLAWDSKNWAVHNDLSWAYFQEGKYQDAYEIAVRGLLFSPQNPWLLNMAGVSQLNMGNKKTAEHFLLKAKTEIEKVSEKQWSRSYPGNDPAIAQKGLAETKKAIEKNLAKSKS